MSLLLQLQDAQTLHQQDAMNCIHFLLNMSVDARPIVIQFAQKSIVSVSYMEREKY